ncbi:MAG: hypothetical protein ACRYGA_06935 [Janthinobacterium lividum]
MTKPLTETALIDSALAALGIVLAHMDGEGPPSRAHPEFAHFIHVRDSTQATSPERVAIHCCLTSASALLDVSQMLIRRSEHLTPHDEAVYWNTLVEQTKVAGRAAYRASLALTDPESRHG